MSDQPKHSLLQQAAQQPDLIPSSQMPGDFFSADEERLSDAEFTAERLFARRPEIYRACVSLLAERVGVQRIGKALGISPNTVMAVRDREGVSVDTEKKDLAGKAMTAAHMAIDGVIEDLSDKTRRDLIPTRDKALIGAMMTDKGLLLSGEATVRVDFQVSEPDHDGFNAYLRGLRSANALGGEKAGANAGASDAAAQIGGPGASADGATREG